ncbi:transglutaminase domain-containing protein [Halobacterium rubrum]|uniref:transglutaminase domain-containing protein n=1 Tax=Halobacterium TaxID=2239 RepID=UPI001F1D4D4D|nr:MULTISPECIES: transglutaminase domain-containing protein [Halobacterium]MDH5019953.1 transglutaminase domain-containing protein [Halobacterium rubrum]
MPDDVPDSRRALLAVAAALALVASAAAAPALGGQAPLGGLDSPASADDLPRALSQFDFVRDLVGEAPQSAGGLELPGGETFGALDPGDSTDVGGPVSEEQLEGAAQPHFLASSDRPQYWRTAAYVTYTGDGWERAPVNTVGPPRPESERDLSWHEVTLRQPASSLPAPWRPVGMSERPVGVGYNCTDGETCDVDFVPTDTGAITAEPPLSAGETYRVESLAPVDDTSALRDIRVSGSFASTQYTSVDTTDRVEQLAERVVGDADNRYDAAKAIERYLEAEKAYSLRDAPETGDSAADEFLFEHDVGYCENYATTMTVMLRSQGVPARYVAGYTSGERVGDDQYLVRGADAHAWVEVFFEDYGWVRFDPTPSAPRQQADSDLAAGTDTYQVRVDSTLVPGDRVNATVLSAGTPVSGAAVSVNGEFAGRTDDAGEVQFTVPYAESVNVTVESPGSGAPGDTDGSTAGGFGTAGVLAQQTGSGEDDDEPRNGSTSREFEVNAAVDVAFDEPPRPGEKTTAQLFVGGQPFPDATVALDGVEQGRTDASGELTVSVPDDAAGVVDVTASRDDLSATVSYPLDDLQVAVSPAYLAPLPGTDATVTVTAGGETVTGATVELNGDRLGVTGEAGTVSATIPFGRTPSVTATASGKTATGYVDWVLPSLALVVLAAAGVVAGVGVALRRRGLTIARVAAALRYAAREVVAAAVEAISGVADAVDDLVAEFRAAAADGWREALAWLAGLPARLRLPDVAGFVRRVAAAARAGSREASASPDGDQSRGALQGVWARFVALVGVDDWQTRTPVEVAQAAVDTGLPREPVERVTESFRAAAYGGGDTESAVAEASEALDALTDRAGDDDDEEGSRQ